MRFVSLTASYALYLQAQVISEKVLGLKHPDVAQSLNNLAWLYLAQGRTEKAERLLRGHSP